MPIQLRDDAGDEALLKVVRQNFTRPPLLARVPLFIEPERALRILRNGGARSGRRDGGGGGGVEAEGALESCLLGGDTFSFFENIGATTTTVESSFRIFSPFIVSHIKVNSDNALNTLMSVFFLVSLDNDTSGGLNTSGVNVFSGPGLSSIKPTPEGVEVFPSKRFPFANTFIKIVFDNQTAGGINVQGHISILYI